MPRIPPFALLALKEWRLLSRNPHGLAVIFFMPAVFVLVMSLTLKNTLVDGVALPPLGWLVETESRAAGTWAEQWLERHPGMRIESRADLRSAITDRRVGAGVIVLDGWLGPQGVPRPERLEVWLGSRTHPAAAAQLRAALNLSLLQVQLRIAAAESGPFASLLLDTAGSIDSFAEASPIPIRYLYEVDSGRRMTAVQQSVPAWLVFGMFFVVIPIAGVLIQERNEGTLARLQTFGVSTGTILGGKLLAFLLLNWVQMGFMLAIGRWVVPIFGGDALDLDVALPWFIAMTLATSIAAVGLALLVSAYSNSFDHAAALGSGLNVVMGAIAGVMVPRVIMPPSLQTISEWSPMGWALDGMQAVFLGAPSASFLLPRIFLLGCFGLICFSIGWRATRNNVVST
jgi:ABC-2 type transport system permease protein